ncbi:MAG: PhzF family phenazine biosynthesis protein [Pseudomonadota bacterium]
MMSYDYWILDVFTDTPFSGNPLAVVYDADNLSDEQMLAIAREFNLSETIFLCAPENPGHLASTRIFTPTIELPFAGHPTVGAAIAIAQQDGGRFDDRIFVLEEKVGPVRISITGGERPFAEFDLPCMPEILPEPLDRDQIAAALGLKPDELVMENHEPVLASAGNAFAFVPVSGLAAMSRIVPNAELLDSLGSINDQKIEPYVYCRETVSSDCAFHARMFAPHMGIPEDPATGSAAAAFSSVIERFVGLGDGQTAFWIEQGIEMGRPSRIRLEVIATGGKMTLARIGGHAVKVAEGRLV